MRSAPALRGDERPVADREPFRTRRGGSGARLRGCRSHLGVHAGIQSPIVRHGPGSWEVRALHVGELWRQRRRGRSRAAFVREAEGWPKSAGRRPRTRYRLANGFRSTSKGDRVGSSAPRGSANSRLRAGDDRRGRDPDLSNVVGRRDRVHPDGPRRNAVSDFTLQSPGEFSRSGCRPRSGHRHRRRRPGGTLADVETAGAPTRPRALFSGERPGVLGTRRPHIGHHGQPERLRPQ